MKVLSVKLSHKFARCVISPRNLRIILVGKILHGCTIFFQCDDFFWRAVFADVIKDFTAKFEAEARACVHLRMGIDTKRIVKSVKVASFVWHHEVCAAQRILKSIPTLAHCASTKSCAQIKEHPIAIAKRVRCCKSRESAAYDSNIDMFIQLRPSRW